MFPAQNLFSILLRKTLRRNSLLMSGGVDKTVRIGYLQDKRLPYHSPWQLPEEVSGLSKEACELLVSANFSADEVPQPLRDWLFPQQQQQRREEEKE